MTENGPCAWSPMSTSDTPICTGCEETARDIAEAVLNYDLPGKLVREERPDEFAIDDDGNVIVLDTWQRNDESIMLRLMMASCTVSIETVAAWTLEQARLADAWACATMLSASDHDDIVVPPRPDFLPPYDSASSRNPITGELA
jgi:hypothetical protein